MRAIQQTRFGRSDVLELADLPIPRPGPDEVLIEVRRAGVNYADIHRREDAYLQRQQLPFVPGAEVAGVIAGTGQRVVALLESGGYAQYAVASADRVFPIPDGVDDGIALALVLQGLTAWHLYRTCARLRGGEVVAVTSGAGGVGSLAVQLGSPMGAGRVIATASTPEKRELCLRLGADAAIDGGPDQLGRRLREANGGAPVDVVLELAGGPVFDEALTALGPKGRMVVYGISSKVQNDVRTGHLLKRSQAIIGFWLYHYLDTREEVERPLAELFALAAAGEIRPVVGGTFGLEEAGRVQEEVEARRTTGKLLLDPQA